MPKAVNGHPNPAEWLASGLSAAPPNLLRKEGVVSLQPPARVWFLGSHARRRRLHLFLRNSGRAERTPERSSNPRGNSKCPSQPVTALIFRVRAEVGDVLR